MHEMDNFIKYTTNIIMMSVLSMNENVACSGVLYANYKQTGKHDHKSVSSIL